MKSKRILVLLPLIVSIALIVGVYVGKKIATPNNTVVFSSPDFQEKNKLQQVINYIQSDYVDTVKEQEIVEETISEILARLDPHSTYIPKRDFQQMNDPLEGNFEGIGIEFRVQEDTVVVVQPVGGGPSDKLGIRAGDRIVSVEGEKIAGVSISNRDVVRLLKGPKGTVVNIEVNRKGKRELLDFAITRDEIPFYSVEAQFMIDEKIGYIKVIRFAKTTYEEFMTAVEELEKQGMEKLVLDLRSNGGGLMKAAIDIADEFLQNKKLVVYTKGKSRAKREYFATSKGKLEDTPVAILIDEGSASASEILAGALQDNDLGFIIGRRSFGKGLVQEGIQWPDGSGIRLTVARYYTPTGRSIQKPYDDGIESYNDEYLDRYKNGELLSLDSIDLPDSLKYYTEEGKVLYGGGGILPDYFVPLDTSNYSPYYSKLNYKGVFYQFGFQYVDENRKEIKEKYSEAEYVSSFNVDAKTLKSLYDFADSKGITFDAEGAEIAEINIKNTLKATIGRNIFGDNVFYQVIYQDNLVMKKAIELLGTKKAEL